MSYKKLFILSIILTLGLSLKVSYAKDLKEYTPVLEQVKTNAFKIDRKKGYLTKKVKTNVYVITDGIWQSAFVTTGEGVILLDAPESFGKHIINAVAEVSKEPIKILVYSHGHVDHIGGSQYLKGLSGLKIIAHKNISNYLKQKNDPRRLIPTHSYTGNHTINLGSEKIQLDHHGNYHSTESDVFMYIAKRKFLMVIDSITPGYVPFMGFDLTKNFHEYLHIFDAILTYDFDVFVGGHLTQLGNKKDVRIAQSYVQDVYETVKRVHRETNQYELMATTAKEVGWDNKFLLFKEFLDHVIKKSATEIEQRWIKKLTGVDVWAQSHAQTALIYVRWEDNE